MVTIEDIKKDKRYTVTLEACGRDAKHYVVRWCDNFIASDASEYKAYLLAVKHRKAWLKYAGIES